MIDPTRWQPSARHWGRIKADIERRLPPTKVAHTRQGDEGIEVKLNCQRLRTQVKIEVNPSLRGHLLPVRSMPCSERVQERFEAFAEARCISHGELFRGKICAALDRQHPRDLFDVRRLLDQEGLADEVRHGMIAGLISHRRPIAELVRPVRKNQSETFKTQFEGMPLEPFTYADHEATLDRLVAVIGASLTGDDRRFLESFEAGDPDWGLFRVAGSAV